MSKAATRIAAAALAVAGIAGGSLLAAGGLFRAPVPDEFLPALVEVPAGEMTVEGSRIAFERPFLIGRYEITFAQWDYCHRDGGCAHRPGDRGWGRGDRPVVDVSWDDAAQYLEWLSDATGERYRLPTEEEWEYAARAGAGPPEKPKPLFSDPNLAWASTYLLTPRRTKRTKPVSSGEGNGFGLFGARDNVWEWTASCRVQTREADGRTVSRENCGVRILQGEHRSPMPSFVRDIGSGGCAVKPMPGNFGFRVVKET